MILPDFCLHFGSFTDFRLFDIVCMNIPLDMTIDACKRDLNTRTLVSRERTLLPLVHISVVLCVSLLLLLCHNNNNDDTCAACCCCLSLIVFVSIPFT